MSFLTVCPLTMSSTSAQPTLASFGAGASSGIGLETARVLALRGVHVVMAVRNVPAGLAAREAILAKVPGARVDVL
jgi:NADP-dependent 3-hydroxy acid dehydrogenase YdfG